MSADRARDREVATVGLSATPHQAKRLVGLSQLRRLRECQQVAAVCYRVAKGGIEFLLVRTRRSGRWTFPKGSTEPGLTHAQAAALEAFEEAGVHGRIEETSFTRYVRRKWSDGWKADATGKFTAVNAHLCEVSRLSPPQEAKRNRTWFSAEDARRRLRERRTTRDGAAFGRVVDKAVERIQQLRGGTDVVDVDLPDYRLRDHYWNEVRRGHAVQKDPLQRARFEASEGADSGAYLRHPGGLRRASVQIAHGHPVEILTGEVLQFAPAQKKKAKALGSGTRNR